MSFYCSVFSLCVAAITCLISVAFVGISFSTDNWAHISVNRPRLKHYADLHPDKTQFAIDLSENVNYYDRVRGIFRICFPYSEKPKVSKHAVRGQKLVLYLNPIDEWCTNMNYFFESLKEGLTPKNLTQDAKVWLHLARGCIVSFAIFFMLTGIGCVIGFMGCWRMSGDHLISTSILMLVATLFGGSGMGLWHGAQFYEYNRVYDSRLEFYLIWPEPLKENTSVHIGWSYILAWVGIAVCLLSSAFFSLGAICIKQQVKASKKREAMMQMNYFSYSNPGQWSTQYEYELTSRSPPPPFSTHPAPGYYSVGYPHHENEESTDGKVIGKYKNVVKELEDGRL